jgi:hypothetical protein
VNIVIPAKAGIHLWLTSTLFGVLTSLFRKEGQEGDFITTLAPSELFFQLRSTQPDDRRPAMGTRMGIGRLLQLSYQRPHLVVA